MEVISSHLLITKRTRTKIISTPSINNHINSTRINKTK
jgi:hypothetical protein